METKLRILLLGDAASIHMQRWAESLAGLGHVVCVASLRKADQPSTLYRTEVSSIRGSGKLGYFAAPLRWRGLINEFQPQIVHAHHITSYGFLGSLLGFSPYFVTSWGSDILLSAANSKIYRWMTLRACRRAVKVFSLAAHMTEAMTRLGIPGEKIVTRPFGVDLGRFTFRPPEPRPAFSEANPFVLFSNRNFHSLYDVASVIRAAHSAKESLPPFELWLAGDGPLKAELQRLAEELGIAGQTRFLGRISWQEMVRRLHAADVFVSSALSDGNNISLCEAMACGAVPVAADIVANSAWLNDASNGFLYKPGDANALGSALKFALAALAQWPSIREQNRRIIEERGSWGRSVEEVERIYRSCVGSGDAALPRAFPFTL